MTDPGDSGQTPLGGMGQTPPPPPFANTLVLRTTRVAGYSMFAREGGQSRNSEGVSLESSSPMTRSALS